jgi:CDP-glucose 4,6-dehydratase
MQVGKYGMSNAEMNLDHSFWKGKKVFLTGHTGFKGAWMCILLHNLGAEVTGFALVPPTTPNLFEISKLEGKVKSITGDVRSIKELKQSLNNTFPDIVIHMAAQALVRSSYIDPIETYTTNVIGTLNVLEAVRECPSVKAIINVTTDKCYENKGHQVGYKEDDPLGGYDPYSSSKACSEIVSASYRQSFYHSDDKAMIATARAGNVIGGGDWSLDRIIPDFMRSFEKKEPLLIRNPNATRPWQHVIEPLHGYLKLAELLCKKGSEFAEAWNFGPDENGVLTVEDIVQHLSASFDQASYQIDKSDTYHEAIFLQLNCTKANKKLGWAPKLSAEAALDKTIEWWKGYYDNTNIYQLCVNQIEAYQKR